MAYGLRYFFRHAGACGPFPGTTSPTTGMRRARFRGGKQQRVHPPSGFQGLPPPAVRAVEGTIAGLAAGAGRDEARRRTIEHPGGPVVELARREGGRGIAVRVVEHGVARRASASA